MVSAIKVIYISFKKAIRSANSQEAKRESDYGKVSDKIRTSIFPIRLAFPKIERKS